MKKQVKKVATKKHAVKASGSFIKPGMKVFIRTVTYHYTGRVVSFDGVEVVLADAAWIAESARWADSLKNGELKEVEPYPDATGGRVMIPFAPIVDVSEWMHALPRKQL